MVEALWSAAKGSFRAAGGVRVVRWLNRRNLRILMYHRFTTRAALERQCAHIREHYNPISLTRAVESLRGGDPLPVRAVAITVDDGYRDFHDIAFPVFSAYQIPATVYVVTRFIDGNYWLWGDRVTYAFRESPLDMARIEMPDGTRLGLPLTDSSLRASSARELKERLKRLPSAMVTEIVDALPSALRVEIPPWPISDFAPMDWDAVRRVAAGGMEIGAHTVTHPILSALESRAQVETEIIGSRRQIEARLGRPVPHFCYPNGEMRDIGPALDVVRANGFATAVTTETGVNQSGADPHLLRRIGVEDSYEAAYFEQCAAAFRV